MTGLIALAERVEKAEGPDDDIDIDIHAAIGGKPRTLPPKHRWNDTPYFTRSLDAAMTLVPEGWNIDLVTQTQPKRSTVRAFGPGTEVGDLIYAATPALALTAAALRARAAQEPRT